MHTQVVRPQVPKRKSSDALRSLAMAAVLLAVLALTALVAWWITAPDGFLLTVEKPSGGTLTAPGITCGTGGSSCSTSGMDGQPVLFRAEADDGYTFAGYTGDCAPDGRVLMDGPHTCGARFDRLPGTSLSADPQAPPTMPASSDRRWPLVLTPPEHGTIVTLEGHQCGTKGQTCTVEIPEGRIVSLDVQADEGYRVQTYTGDCKVDGTANMTAARECGVVLVPGQGPRLQQGSPPVAAGRPQPKGPATGTAKPGPGAAAPVTAGGAATVGPAPGPVTPPAGNDGPGPVTPVAPAAPSLPEADREAAEKLARQEILVVLKAYREAYARMDIPGMKRLQPGIDVRRHQIQFMDLKSVKYTFGGDPVIEDLDVLRGEAKAIVDIKTENEPKAGKKQKPLENTTTFMLKRIGETKDWHIILIKYEPK